MSNQCCWPKCRQESTAVIHAGNKAFSFCETHGNLVQSEDETTMKRSRKKVCMPMPEIIDGMAAPGLLDPRSQARCAKKDCGRPVSLIVFTPSFPRESGGIPVCDVHYRKAESISWDGVWRKFLPNGALDDVPLYGEDKIEEKETKEPGNEEAKELREERIGNSEDFLDDLLKRLDAGELDP